MIDLVLNIPHVDSIIFSLVLLVMDRTLKILRHSYHRKHLNFNKHQHKTFFNFLESSTKLS